MKHLLRTTQVDAPFSSVIDYVAQFFTEHPRLHVDSIAAMHIPVAAETNVIDDATDQTRHHEALLLFLRPKSRLVPNFRGAITVRPHFSGAILRLEGSYNPPGGMLGNLFDVALGKWLAIASLDRLLTRLRRNIESSHRAFAQSCPTIKSLNDHQTTNDTLSPEPRMH